jgi:hypothetical protein
MSTLLFVLGLTASLHGQVAPEVAPAVLAEDVFEHPLADPRPPAWQEISGRSKTAPVFRAKFVQVKKLVALRRPLRSSGEFLCHTERGISWTTFEPHRTVFIITRRGLFQAPEGEAATELSTADQPMVRQMAEVFDEKQLLEHFRVFFVGDAANWRIGLEPKGVVLQKVIRRIVLEGGQTVKTLILHEASGDRTDVIFDPILDRPLELTEEEEKSFREH